MADLRTTKLDRSFAQMDVDGDGRIERDDVLALGARILVGFGEAPTTLKGRRIIDRFDAVWAEIVRELDTDGDNVISPQEYRQGMTAAFIEGPKFDAIFRPAAEAIADLADTDGDGMVGPAEFEVLQRGFGTSAQDARSAFARLDITGDGQLSVAELVQAAREFYTGDDAEATGNWLFGPVP